MIYDISPIITPQLKVFPGDTPPSREVLLDISRGDSLTLSTLHSTVHVGAHVDAPSHYGADGGSIESQELEVYIGPCQVVRVQVARGARFGVPDLHGEVRDERVLFATGTYPDPDEFNNDFAAMSPELVDWLSRRGVILVGIDTPSVDHATSKDLPAHKAFLRNDMCILEGIVLAGVPEGRYELIALPLRLAGFDASPVRAILRSLDRPPHH